MQFKREAILLVLAISLFGVATFLYTYQATNVEGAMLTQSTQSITHPYCGIAICLVGVGFASMVAASISYQRKNKNLSATQV